MSCPSACAGILGPSVTSRSIAPTNIFCSNPRPLTPRGPLCDEPGNDPREPVGSQHRTGAAAEQRPARVAALSAALYLEHRLRVDRKSTRLNSSHGYISYAVFCLKKKNTLTLF